MCCCFFLSAVWTVHVTIGFIIIISYLDSCSAEACVLLDEPDFYPSGLFPSATCSLSSPFYQIVCQSNLLERWDIHKLFPSQPHIELPLPSLLLASCCWRTLSHILLGRNCFPYLLMPVLICFDTARFANVSHIRFIFCSTDSCCQRRYLSMWPSTYWYLIVVLILFCVFHRMSAQLEPGQFHLRFFSAMFIAPRLLQSTVVCKFSML